MKDIVMGDTYWEIDGTTSSYQTLKEFLGSIGLVEGESKPFGTEIGFKRVTEWSDGTGLKFQIIWYINYCTIRFGSWEGGIMEAVFDRIIGSYLPYAEHKTLDFTYRGNRTILIALKED